MRIEFLHERKRLLAASEARGDGSGPTDLRDIIATQMPLTNPGSLKPAQVDAVLAYILQQNKYPAGDTPLTADKSKTVKIVKQS